MMRAPAVWQHDGVAPRLLSPISGIVSRAAARRIGQPGWPAPVPVICCGNVTVGGTGKTTLALDLGARLFRRGARVAFLTRGYRGRLTGPVQVTAGHGAADVGDEALLLAGVAPTFVGADRAAAAQLAIMRGATVLVMDDGLQNPGLIKSHSLLVIDGAAGFGNGRVLPAGPLREPVADGAGRCIAAVVIGPETADLRALPRGMPVLRAALRPVADELAGKRVLAFAGIGRPSKFFATVVQAGAVLVGQRPFPDHHRYRTAELTALLRQADRLQAALVTTPKDAVRLPPAFQAHVMVAGVALQWADEAQIEAILGDTV